MFAIQFTSDKTSQSAYGGKVACGEITLGAYQETFESPISYWAVRDYEKQWESATLRLASGKKSSCLITSINDPATANFIFWWPLWRIGDSVHVQNQLLFLDRLRKPFDPINPYDHMPRHELKSSEGDKISEWVVPFGDIVRWAKK